MSKTVGDQIVARLKAWGVERVFGYPGDGINGVMGGLERAKEEIHFVQVRHEESAAFMATAHAKFTGQVGVCIATSGPGAIHLLNGLYDARLDHQPVVALVGQQARASLGGSYQQEVDLVSLFKDVAGEYVQMATDPAQIRHLIDRALRIAISERTVTCIILPNDLQELDAVEVPPREHGTVHSSTGITKPRIIPAITDLEKAAAILNEGKKVAMLVGAGAFGAAEKIKLVADLLGAGVAKALLGKAVIDDDIPYCTGAIGLLGTKPSWDMMSDCDTLLMIGSGFPYAEFLPKEGQARGVQIDIDGKMLGLRYPMELNLQGDSKDTLAALIPLLKRKEDRSWQEELIKGKEQWMKVLEARANNSANPINPQKIFWELNKYLPSDAILTADSGSVAAWYARDLMVKETMKASLSGGLATMCPAIPYAIAAKFAYPTRLAVAMLGDGAMQMQGINELISIAKYMKQWADPRMVIIVLNNRDLNMVSWEQRTTDGMPKFDDSQDVPDFPYAQYAQMLGLEGIRVERPEDIENGLVAAFAARKPFVLEVLTDPDVPILPPHIAFKQAKSFLKALLGGDGDAWGMVKQTYKEVIDEYFPGK